MASSTSSQPQHAAGAHVPPADVSPARRAAAITSAELVESLMGAAFDRSRSPRSDAYKRGTRWALDYHTLGFGPSCPYPVGTAEADAFFAGRDEGNAIWREHMNKQVAGVIV